MNRNRIIILIAVALMSFASVLSCNKEHEQVATINLVAPAEDAKLDLSSGNVLFKWVTSASVQDGFTLVIYNEDASLSKAFPVKGTAYSREIVASDFDLLVKEWGARPEQAVPVSWTVQSTKDGQAAECKARNLSVKALPAIVEPISSMLPAENVILDLDNESSFMFQWSRSSHISQYKLEIAAEENGEAVKVWNSIQNNSIVLGKDDLLAIAEQLDPDKKTSIVPVFWKVSSMDEFYTGSTNYTRIRLMRDVPSPLTKVTSLKVAPGYNRAMVSCVIEDPRTSKLSVSYGDKHIEYEIATGEQNFSAEITGLPESEITFSVSVSDVKGNSSEPVNASARIYGDAYKATKAARGAKLIHLMRDGAGISVDECPDVDFVRTHIGYSSESDGIVIAEDAQTVTIPLDILKQGEEISVMTEFKPEVDAIDVVTLSSAIYVPVYGMYALENCKHWPNPSSDAEIIAGDHGMLGGFGYEKLFDGQYNLTSENMWHSSGSTKNASASNNSINADTHVCLTVDLGEDIYISSIVFWGRRSGVIREDGTYSAYGDSDKTIGSYWAYGSYNPRHFELWVSSEMPTNIGDEAYWNPSSGLWKTDGKWTKIMSDCHVYRPSGKTCPTGYTTINGVEDATPTLKDMQQAINGFEFSVDSFDTPVHGRYVRMVILDNWDQLHRRRISMDELHFYNYKPLN